MLDARPRVPAAPEFDQGRRWQLNPQVALRDESFGALAYHYGSRRLIFLRSELLVRLVQSLDQFESAEEALDAGVPLADRASYLRALGWLAAAGVIDAR